MKIYALTIGDINIASSRLRSFYLFWFARKYCVSVNRKDFFNNLDADIFHIQKKVSISIFLKACFFRLLGKIVIFDVDDQPSSFRIGSSWLGSGVIWIAFYLMIFISTITTVDTHKRRKYWQRFGFDKIYVIKDVVDINPELFLQLQSKHISDIKWNKNLVWIGHPTNIKSIDHIIKSTDIKNNFFIKIITAENDIRSLKSLYPWIDFIPWEKDILLRQDFLGSYMILNQLESKSSIFKSDNKMILALISGLTPIVSPTPSYVDLADKIKSKYLVYSSVDDIFSLVKVTSQEKRNKTFFRAKKFIFNNYRSEIIFNDLMNCINKIRS